MKKIFVNLILILCGICWVASVAAQQGAAELGLLTDLPDGCEPSNYQFQDDQLLIGQDTGQHLYLLRNRSKQAIYVNHEKVPPGASAGWMSMLDAGQWSAIAVNKKDFALVCSAQQAGKTANISCQRVLSVCTFPNAVFPNNLQSDTFWITENQTFCKLVAGIEKRGIKVP